VNHRGVKGTQDIFTPEVEVWRFIESTASRVFENFGFQEIRVPIIEHTDVFTRSIGETTDIVEKEMYTFQDKGGRSITLRPEGTAPVVRAFVQHSLYAKRPINKFYYTGPMFRYERPQAGRYRQFQQIGVEAFGSDDPRLDAEMLLMLKLLLEKLGLKDLDCQVNSIGCPECRPGYMDVVRAYFHDLYGELCSECQRRFEINPLRIMDCKAPKCRELRVGAPSVLDYLDNDCSRHFNALTGMLQALEVPYTVNPNLIRGLDYYTRTTFEVIASGLGAQNAVAAGGRYDGLVAEFGGPEKTPALGFAIGVERMVSLIKETYKHRRRPALFIAALSKEAEKMALILSGRLRGKGVWTEISYDSASLKSQMRRADKLNAEYVLIIGEEELKRGSAPLRNMNTKEQVDLWLDKVVEQFT